MKKILTILILVAFMPAHSGQITSDQAQMDWAKQHFAKQGVPIPDGGITILPEAQMSQFKQFKDEKIKDKNDIAQYGYIRRSHPSLNNLLNIQQVAKHQIRKYEMNYNPRSTHLRKSAKDLFMAYTFIGVPESVMSKSLGAAPYLTYLKDQGWVGAVQYFYASNIGNCSYSENNITLSHGSVIVAKEDVRYDVNQKTTLANITGLENEGFLYDVEWYDNTFFRHLECANKKFDKNIMNQVIKMASKIDDNQ